MENVPPPNLFMPDTLMAEEEDIPDVEELVLNLDHDIQIITAMDLFNTVDYLQESPGNVQEFLDTAQQMAVEGELTNNFWTTINMNYHFGQEGNTVGQIIGDFINTVNATGHVNPAALNALTTDDTKVILHTKLFSLLNGAPPGTLFSNTINEIYNNAVEIATMNEVQLANLAGLAPAPIDIEALVQRRKGGPKQPKSRKK